MVQVGRGGKQAGKGREERLLTTTGVNEPTRKKICGQKKKKKATVDYASVENYIKKSENILSVENLDPM